MNSFVMLLPFLFMVNFANASCNESLLEVAAFESARTGDMSKVQAVVDSMSIDELNEVPPICYEGKDLNYAGETVNVLQRMTEVVFQSKENARQVVQILIEAGVNADAVDGYGVKVRDRLKTNGLL